MTTTSPVRQLSDSRPRGLHPGRAALMILVRLAVLVGCGALYGHLLPASADPVGAGLAGFMLSMVIAAAWAFVDGWRHRARVGLLVWAVTAVLDVVVSPLPDTLSYAPYEGGWTGLPDYLARVGDGFGFMLALIALPALVGLGVGQLLRLSLRQPRH